jgi:hypothetical protein
VTRDLRRNSEIDILVTAEFHEHLQSQEHDSKLFLDEGSESHLAAVETTLGILKKKRKKRRNEREIRETHHESDNLESCLILLKEAKGNSILSDGAKAKVQTGELVKPTSDVGVVTGGGRAEETSGSKEVCSWKTVSMVEDMARIRGVERSRKIGKRAIERWGNVERTRGNWLRNLTKIQRVYIAKTP